MRASSVVREVPIDFGADGVAAIRPGFGLAAQGLDVVDTPIKALCRVDAQFDLGEIEPTFGVS